MDADLVAPSDIATVRAATPEQLFLSHFPAMRRLAVLLVHDAAVGEELAMDAFVTACSRLGGLDRPEAYLRRVVVNLCCSRVRRWAAERRAHARVASGSETVVPAWDPTADERSRAVAAAVAALPTRQRACVVLHYFEGLSTADIGAALGCAPGTVKSQMAKARATLGATLHMYAEDLG